MEKGIYGTDMDTDSHTVLGWLWLSVICSVHGESVLEYNRGGSLRGDSMTDGWLKLVFVKEILVRPMSISAT